MLGVDPPALVGPLEEFGQPFVEPQRDVADRRVQQGVGRLVAEVFQQAVSRVGVDDPLPALRQEERPARGELRVVERQEPRERLAIVEDIDVDRRRAPVGPQPERRLDLALQRGELPQGRGVRE